MAEDFEFQDLSDSEFWGVDLQRARLRDVDLSGARITHSRLVDVTVDAEIDRLVVNGVDVTAYVNERDEWFALRSQLRPRTAAQAAAAWPGFVAAWEDAIAIGAAHPQESVGGEWSFVQTLRHLVMATDKWFTVPVLGATFHPIGLPNTGSSDVDFPGLDPAADPTFDEALAVWRDRAHRFGEGVAGGLDPTAVVPIVENGPCPVLDCLRVVLEEHFHHLRYARRDLALLASGA